MPSGGDMDEKTASAVSLLQQIMDMSQQVRVRDQAQSVPAVCIATLSQES